MQIDLLRLSDRDLATIIRDAREELVRRSPSASDVDASAIRGNELAKRATVVAATGGHSLLLVGPSGVGKTMLRRLAIQLGVQECYEARTCPCGAWNDPYRDCRCEADAIVEFRRQWPVCQITVECARVPEREMLSRPLGSSTADMRKTIGQAVACDDMTLDEHSQTLVRVAVPELGIDCRVRNQCLLVARTIANLDGAATIGPHHVSEAFNYRPLGVDRF